MSFATSLPPPLTTDDDTPTPRHSKAQRVEVLEGPGRRWRLGIEEPEAKRR